MQSISGNKIFTVVYGCIFALFLCIEGPVRADDATVATTIKSNDTLVEYDQRLNALYNGLLLSLEDSDKKALRIEQRAWLKKRNADFDKSSDATNVQASLETSYKDRLEVLDQQFNKLPDIPVEAMLKYPSLWNELQEGRFMPDIKAPEKLDDLAAFTALEKCIAGLESGRWVTTSYMTWAGSIIHDIGAANYFFKEKMSFAPQLINDERPIEQKLAPLVAWSYEGMWNRKAYQTCEGLYKSAAAEMSGYYNQYYSLSPFAAKGMDLLSSYIAARDMHRNTIIVSPAFAIFSGPLPPLDQLKKATAQFRPQNWDTALAIALLNHAPANIIAWLIQSGADVNTSVNDEYPLMRAVEQPEIITLLLQKGADPAKETPYGKSALFYAVQYNQPNTVDLLISAGANVNHSIKNLNEIKSSYHHFGGNYLVEKVAEFTPLVYSLRYASPGITDYLKKHGATLGKASPQVIHDWVMQSANMNEAEFKKRIMP